MPDHKPTNPTGKNGSQQWKAADTERMRQLHGDGMSCNGIAREMGFNPQVISRRCRAEGLSFDRSRVEAANIARSVDAKARRQAAVAEIYDFLGDTFGHAKSVRTGEFKTTLKGEYGSEVESVLDFIPTPNRKDLAASMTQLVNAATKLESIDSDSGVADAVTLLGKMANALGLSDEVDPTDDDDGI